jgi:putative serine protease PepD
MAAGALICVALVAATVVEAIEHSSAPASTSRAPTANTQTPTTRQQAVDKLVPSVVKVTTQRGSRWEVGSGVILTSDGLILTANTVLKPVDGADGATTDTTVTFAGGRTAPYSFVGADSSSNLAVIRVEGVSGLTPISMGSSADLRVNEQVIAVESPPGLETSVVDGVVTALNVPVTIDRYVVDAIETDALVGAPGGPLANMSGQLMGLMAGSSTKGSVTRYAAIPADQAKRIADALVATGTAPHATLGVELLDDGGGAKVASVQEGGPAAKAGLPAGVVITRLNDRVIDSTDALGAAMWLMAPGDRVTLSYIESAGATKTIAVTLGQR